MKEAKFICPECGREMTWGKCPQCGNEQEDACASDYCSCCPICGAEFEPFCDYCLYVRPFLEEADKQ